MTANTINAGVYVLEREVLELIPKGQPCSIEREFFPLLLERELPFYGFVSDGYWLDIGTPAKYLQAQQDLLAGGERGKDELGLAGERRRAQEGERGGGQRRDPTVRWWLHERWIPRRPVRSEGSGPRF